MYSNFPAAFCLFYGPELPKIANIFSSKSEYSRKLALENIKNYVFIIEKGGQIIICLFSLRFVVF